MSCRTLLIFIFLIVVGCSHQKTKFVWSHNKTAVQLFKLDNKQLAYLVKNGENTVIDTSLLGIIVNEKILGVTPTIRQLETHAEAFDYPISGVKNNAHYMETFTKFEIEESDHSKWYLEFQLSDEGVAFRYIVPSIGTNKVSGELSSFKLPEQTKVWFFERENDWKLKSHAGEWIAADISQMPVISKMGPVQGLTLTCELPDKTYALIAEAALFNYSGLRLEAIGNNTFKANFTEGESGFEIDGDIVTPWRCILLADDLNKLVNNTMVASLNPQPDKKLFDDTSWIKPGKAAWYWWSGRRADLAAEMKVVDNAAQLGFQYTMVDEGWEEWDNKWVVTTKLCNHAKEKGIGIFLWKHSSQLNFPENKYAVMAGFLDSIKQTGAVGVKVDFMNGETKSLIDFDEALLKLAAERKLMVNFHGCQQSSGEYRTYPNEVSREGIRGIELNNMEEGPLPASHNAALPFTRFVTGHADYTPIAFTSPGNTTWAHQLATLVCFYSGFQCIAEDPEFLLHSPKIQPALSLFKAIPTVWNETIVLPESLIGELALMVRRKGNDWYLGALSSGVEKQLVINCDFLNNGTFSTEIFSDDLSASPINLSGLNPQAYLKNYTTAIPFRKEELSCDKNTSITLNIAANGGAVIWFKSVTK